MCDLNILKRYILACVALCVMTTGVRGQNDKSDLFVLEGHRQMLLGNHTDAYYLTWHALQLNPRSVAALQQLAEFMHYMRSDSLATHYMELAAQYAPDDYWSQQPLVELYVGTGQTDKAIALLERLAQKFTTNNDVLMMLETLYKQKGDFANVVRMLDMLEMREGKSEQLSMEKFRTYMQMSDSEHAFAEIKALADEYPNDLRYRVLLGDMYANQQRYDEALDIYRSVEAEAPDNISLMASMLNYYSLTNQDSLYQRQLEAISTNPKLDADTRFRFLNTMVYEHLQGGKKHDHLLQILEQVLQLPQTDNRIAELCARYMITIEQPPQRGKPVLTQMLRFDPSNLMARSQLLQYAIDVDDTLEVVRVCQPAVDLDLDDPVFYYYLGIAYLQTDSAQKAVDTFRHGFRHVDSETNLQLVTNMYALLGDSYHQLNDMPHAYEAYDSCLMYRPDDALVLNNYAYYLSLEHRQLDKAEEMSRRSLEKEGDNPTYIDTYAWIMFQQKRYEEARRHIERALQLMGDNIDPSDANIMEHAGDIYAKCKLMDKAVEYWQRSQSLGNDTQLINKKIKKRKYYAY